MRLHVTHRTTYRFDRPLRTLVQSLRLWPTEFDGQDVHGWSVRIEGQEAERGAALRDGAGDWIETVSMRGVSEVTIAVDGEVETRDLSGVVRGLREKVPPGAYLRAGRMTGLSDGLREAASEVAAGADGPLALAHGLAGRVRETIAYVPNTTGTETSAADAFAAGEGVCQDQAHAIIAMGRAVGLPGRYVVGYLHADETGTAHLAGHAWAELWVEGLGWVGFDAANGCCPDERYIRIGSGLDAIMAAPIRGVSQGQATETLETDVQVMEGAATQ